MALLNTHVLGAEALDADAAHILLRADRTRFYISDLINSPKSSGKCISYKKQRFDSC